MVRRVEWCQESKLERCQAGPFTPAIAPIMFGFRIKTDASDLLPIAPDIGLDRQLGGN